MVFHLVGLKALHCVPEYDMWSTCITMYFWAPSKNGTISHWQGVVETELWVVSPSAANAGRGDCGQTMSLLFLLSSYWRGIEWPKGSGPPCLLCFCLRLAVLLQFMQCTESATETDTWFLLAVHKVWQCKSAPNYRITYSTLYVCTWKWLDQRCTSCI